jgi:hypothetical protein
MCSQLAPCREPEPLARLILAHALDETGPLRVMMDTAAGGRHIEMQQSVDGLLNSPAEAFAAVLVDGLKHEEHRTDLEDGCANNGGDACTPSSFGVKGCRRRGERKPSEEAVNDPDGGTYPSKSMVYQVGNSRTNGEDGGDIVRYVPHGIPKKHLGHAVQHGAQSICRLRSLMPALRGVFRPYHKRMTPFPIIAASPYMVRAGRLLQSILAVSACARRRSGNVPARRIEAADGTLNVRGVVMMLKVAAVQVRLRLHHDQRQLLDMKGMTRNGMVCVAGLG